MSSPTSKNPLDSHVNSEWMRVCKCILPYLDRSVQKNIAISLKVMELMSVVQLYSAESALDPISLTRDGSWEKDLLQNVRSNLSPDKAFIIDAVIKISEAKKILAHHEKPATEHPPKETLSLYNPADPIEKESSPQTDTSSGTNEAPFGNSSFNPMDMIEKLSPLLDDNQRQMINLFSTLMKS